MTASEYVPNMNDDTLSHLTEKHDRARKTYKTLKELKVLLCSMFIMPLTSSAKS